MLNTPLRTLALFGLLALAPLAVQAQEEPPAESRAAAPARVLWSYPEAQITLPVEEAPANAEVAIPQVPISGKPIALRFRARFQWPVAGGMARNLGLALNQQKLGPENAPVVNRDVIESSIESFAKPPTQGNGWWMPNKGWSLVLHFAPHAGTLEPRVLSDVSEGQWYLLVVTDLLSTNSENKLELTNHATTATWESGKLRDATGIVIESLSLVELEEIP